MKKSTWLMIGFWIAMLVLVFAGHFLGDSEFTHIVLAADLFFLTGLMFAWFMFDARENNVEPSAGLKIAVVAFGAIAVPYYLIKTKGWRRALLSFLKFLGLLVVFILLVALVFTFAK